MQYFKKTVSSAHIREVIVFSSIPSLYIFVQCNKTCFSLKDMPLLF